MQNTTINLNEEPIDTMDSIEEYEAGGRATAHEASQSVLDNGGAFMDITDECDAGGGATGQEASQLGPDNGGDETTTITSEISEKIKSAVIGKSWKTMEEAEQFYQGFALWRGFAVKRYKNYRSTSGEITYRKWSCTRAGLKRTTPKGNNGRRGTTKKCDCNAFMTASKCKVIGCWTVIDFNDEHNHMMTPISQQRFVSQYRIVTPEHIEAAQLLRKAGIRVSQIYSYFAARSEGIQNISFTHKDLYNELASNGNYGVRKGGDSDAAMDYMIAQKLKDPNFFYTFKRDDENSLSHLLWFDGQSRMDYACFGDVLIFDATYKTNTYGMPLVILAGVSNHHITVPFAFALVHDENTSTYEWLLRQFIENMSNRAPKSVVTDNDKAMGCAIGSVFGSSVTYRLCGWHVLENAKKYIYSKGFAKDMSDCIFGDLTRDEFEVAWSRMIIKHGIDKHKKAHKWAKETYRQRHLWANAYLRGSFFGPVRTTQRVEGLNARVKRGARGSMRIWELVTYLDFMVQKVRDLQAHAEFNSNTRAGEAPSTHRWLHQHASSIYTPKSMDIVATQIVMSGELVVHRRVPEDGYYIVMQPESGVRWKVDYTKDPTDFYCECQFLQTVGFPCRHIFKVMREEHIFELPEKLIMKRWTKYVRDVQHETTTNGWRPDSEECHFSSLAAKFREAVYEAKENDDASQSIFMALSNVIDKIRHQRAEETNYKHARNPKPATKCMKKKKRKTRKGKATLKYTNEGTIHTRSDDPEPSDVPETHQPDTDLPKTQTSTQQASDAPVPSQTQLSNVYVTWDILRALRGDIAPNNSKDAIYNY